MLIDLEEITEFENAAQGGDRVLREHHRALLSIAASRPGDVIVIASDGDVEATYAALLSALG